MNSELILKLESLIEGLNPRQQALARNLVINPNYQFLEITQFDRTDIYIIDKKLNKNYILINFIKERCGCD
jgi:hypothetical protein